MNRDCELKFGTSGLRGLVSEMTDREVYLNTLGFLSFLKEGQGAQSGSKIALAGDLRASTPRIMAAVHKAVKDSGWQTLCAGHIPSPALALFATGKGIPGIMVTGSHIPEDRNGIKFTKTAGEILKEDEPLIVKNVKGVRQSLKNDLGLSSLFSQDGMFKTVAPIPQFEYEEEATKIYTNRYDDFFPSAPLSGLTLVHYEQSAVGRDLVTHTLKKLGANVISTGRCENFLPVDTEKISDSTRKIVKQAAETHHPFAILSTDGDSDRPLLADENGEIIPGDKLGGLAALYLKPDFVALPISTNEAVIQRLIEEKIPLQRTKIGSPYVIKVMEDQKKDRSFNQIAGWEANGGFLTATDWKKGQRVLGALCTRDAVLPIVSTLLLAREYGISLSKLFSESFIEMHSQADVLDNTSAGMETYTAEKGTQIINYLSPSQKNIQQVDFENASCALFMSDQRTESVSGDKAIPLLALRQRLTGFFPQSEGFAEISSMNFIDGIRMTFRNSETVHLRPSGNAPEFRVYAFAATNRRAKEILEKRYTIIPKIYSELEALPT